jgi:hypothetical protein
MNTDKQQSKHMPKTHCKHGVSFRYECPECVADSEVEKGDAEDFAHAAQQAPEPTTALPWRALLPGEVIQEGDEYFHKDFPDEGWQPIHDAEGHQPSCFARCLFRTRRPLLEDDSVCGYWCPHCEYFFPGNSIGVHKCKDKPVPEPAPAPTGSGTHRRVLLRRDAEESLSNNVYPTAPTGSGQSAREWPVCGCGEVWPNKGHHPDCPVLRELTELTARCDAAEAKLAELEKQRNAYKQVAKKWCNLFAEKSSAFAEQRDQLAVSQAELAALKQPHVILDRPDAPGNWWFRESIDHKWRYAGFSTHGMYSGPSAGQWTRATPPDVLKEGERS